MPTLTPTQVDAAIRLHDRMVGWRTTDAALVRLKESMPTFDAASCLLKAVAINALYGTQVFSIVRMAEHAENVLRRTKIEGVEWALVERIAKLPPNAGDKPRVFLSFAAKFCHFFIDEERFPIYDDAARAMLRLHLGTKRYPVSPTAPYEAFCCAFQELRSLANLKGTGRDLDRYLWIAGMYRRWLRERGKRTRWSMPNSCDCQIPGQGSRIRP